MIPGIGTLGGTELLIALVIILLIFGAKRVPELGKSLGIEMKELSKEAAGSGDEEKPEQGPRDTGAKGRIAPGAGKEEHSVMNEGAVDGPREK